jgi:DNA-directed RNA polymerase subunit RPC12/RpoP
MKCPNCGTKIGKPMPDEWAECSCGWTALMDENKVARIKDTD